MGVENLMFVLIIRVSKVPLLLYSLGRVFGVPGPQRGWRKIVTHDNLINRGFSLVGWYCMSQYSEEMVGHLLLHCDVAYAFEV